MLVWTEEEYGTGVPEIDAQHRELFEHVNTLHDAVKSGKTKAEVWETLEFLDDYTHRHFRCEEVVMEGRGCSMCRANREDHEKFIEQLQTMRLQVDREGVTESLRQEIEERILGWIESHIKKVDTGLRETVVNTD